MQNKNENFKGGPGTKSSIPKMQSTTIKSANPNNKNIRQANAPAYKSTGPSASIHQEDWKMTPSGIKYRENYVGGFRLNYSGNDPMNEGHGNNARPSAKSTYGNANESPLTALYNFGYILLLIASVMYLLVNGIFRTAAVPLAITFAVIFSLKKSLSKKGCLVNFIMYILIIVFLLIFFNVR